MATQKYVWFGMKVTPEQKQKIKRLAQRQGLSAKEAVIKLVEEALAREQRAQPVEVRPGSFLDGIEDIVGAGEGPEDRGGGGGRRVQPRGGDGQAGLRRLRQ